VYLLFIAVQAYGPTQFEVWRNVGACQAPTFPRIPYIRSTPRQVTRHPPDGMHPENPGKCGRCRVFVAWSRGMRGQPTNQPTNQTRSISITSPSRLACETMCKWKAVQVWAVSCSAWGRLWNY